MRKILTTYSPACLVLAFMAMVLLTCGGGGGGSDSGTPFSPTPSVKSVVITGTVPGTVAIAYDYATGKEVTRDVADGTPKRFTLNLEPGEYYLMFLANEGTPDQGSYAFYNVTGGNVFTFEADTTLDLGALVFNNYPRTATPQIDPISGNGNVTETYVPEASFSQGGKWTATRTFVNSTCSGHSPGTTVTENVTITHGYGLVSYASAGSTDTAIGFANVHTAILTSSESALETIYLTMQADGSLAGSFSKVGYGGGCSEEGTITAVQDTSPPPDATLIGLTINGPSSMPEYSTATYTATASWSDGSTSTVTPSWSVLNSQMAGINTDGVLYYQGVVSSDQTATVHATYSSGGIIKTAGMNVTITRGPSVPFTDQELSGQTFFQEYSEGGGYESFLYILNADSSPELYATFALPRGDASHYVTGIWSNDPDGLNLDFRFADYGPCMVQRIADSPTEMEVVIYDIFWGVWSSVLTWEKTVPVDPSKLPGTYTGSDGYTWVFNADGTGSVPDFGGGITFSWSVDSDGVLRMPANTGYTASFYARATSESTSTEYTILRAGFPEHNTSTGGFYKYYGGIELTRQ